MTTLSWRRSVWPSSSWAAPAIGRQAALIDGSDGRVVSYGELAVSVRRAAAGLAARGVARGDVHRIPR